MITKISSENRYHAHHGWLSTYHLFSFADYYDPRNMNFGVLRVFNDDTIDGESGFGAHSHRDMEIVTIMLEGELTHQDNMGNTAILKKGEVQYMSAGTGVTHSEVNASKEKTHLYQIWIMPKAKNLAPTYGQKDFSTREKKNVLVPVASDKVLDEAIVMQADATIYKAELAEGVTVKYALEKGRGLFVYVIQGSIDVNGSAFQMQDQARIKDERNISITAPKKDARFIAIDVLLEL